MSELKCLRRSSAAQQEVQFQLAEFVCVPPQTRFLFVSAPNSVNTSRDSQRENVCGTNVVCVCVCVQMRVCSFDFFFLVSGLYLSVC